MNKLFIAILTLIPLALHFYVNAFTAYGIFRDEFYYLACAQHPALGYVDQPPLSIFILIVSKFLFGESLFALRIVPSVASGLTVFFTCLMTRKLGGGTTAILISSVCVIFAPVYLGMFGFYSMNSTDILFTAIAFYLVILMTIDDKQILWIMLGIIFGLGLLNKIGFLWICFGFFAGLIFTDRRRVYLTPKPYITACISLIIFLPFIIWNIQNDFAHVEFIRNATSEKYSSLNRIDFVTGQFLNMNPLSAVVWLSGIYFFFINRKGKQFILVGLIFFISFAVLLLNSHSKAEYLSPTYTALFAGGAATIEKLSNEKFRPAGAIVIFILLISGILLSPLALPVLPADTFIRYSKTIGVAPQNSENNELSELPQHYADMFGWEEFAKKISEVYLKIPEEERNHVLFFGRNYGEAGAIEYFSSRYPLPPAISGHNNYWLWKYPTINDPVIIIAGGDTADHKEVFASVEQAGFHSVKYSMPYENNLPVYVLRRMKIPIEELWVRVKDFE